LATRFGTHAEGFVAAEYERETGRKVQRYNAMLRHPEAPIIGHVDRLVVPDGAKVASHKGEIRTDLGLEAKTVNQFAANTADWGDGGTDEVPAAYLIQCQAYMLLTGCPRWDLAALIGGNADFRIYHFRADPDLHDMLATEADRWWRAHVLADTPPDPQSEAEARQRWSAHQPGKVADVDAGVADMLRQYAAIKAEMRDLEKQEKALRDQIIPALADAEVVEHGGQKLATFKANKPSRRTDWKTLAHDLLERLDLDQGERDNLIEHNTVLSSGARVLRLTKAIQEACE